MSLIGRHFNIGETVDMSNVSTSNTSLSNCTYEGLESAILFYFCMAMLGSVMTAVTIIVNCVLIATMLSQKLVHKSISNKLLVVLSIFDLLQGISTWPVAAANFVTFHRMDTNCFLLNLNYMLAHNLLTLTIWTIFIVVLEQYIAILHPYFYISNLTFCRLLIPVLVLNILLMTTYIVGRMKMNQKWNDTYNFLALAMGIPIIAAFIYMHTKITYCASQVAKRITNTNKEEGKNIKSRAKAAKSGLIVLLATSACYFPNMCYIIYEKVSRPTPSITTFAKYSTEILGLSSSVVDPLVYYWRLKSLRKASKNMFASCCKSKKVGNK